MHSARSVLALVVFAASMSLAAWPAFADASHAADGRFELRLVEKVKEHTRSEKLDDVCRVGFRVRGCTDFPVEKLDCHCEAREDSWVLVGSARIEAVIHLSYGEPIGAVLLHEQAHIGDVENGLRHHFGSIMSIRFSTQRSCERYANTLVNSPHLQVVMNELRIASNIKFGCDRKGIY